MRVITREQLRAVLDLAGVMPFDGGLIGDRGYVMFDRAFLAGEFSRAYRKFAQDLGIHQWLPEKNDCDNHARLCAAFASILHARTPGAPEAELAFGEFWFVRDTGAGHALNVAIVPANTTTGLSLLFYEPQEFRVITLTQSEVQSCTGYRI